MKPRKLVVGALVVWYIWLPPVKIVKNTVQVQADKPISQWVKQPHHSFESKESCEDAITVTKIGIEELIHRKKFTTSDLPYLSWLYGVCMPQNEKDKIL